MMPDQLKIFFINIFTFLVSLHYAIIIYSESTYLTKYLGGNNIWIVYSIASGLTVLLTLSATSLLKKFQITSITKIILGLAFINLIFIPYQTDGSIIIFSMVIYMVLAEFLLLLPSIMLEHFSKDSTTGSIRGFFIAAQSTAYVLAPFFTSILIRNFGLESMFTFGAFFLLISFIFFYFTIDEFPKIQKHNKNLQQTFRKIFRNHNIRNILISQVGLSTFYCAVLVYIPFKMGEVGIDITRYLGVILPLALTNFIFIPPLLGHTEDNFKNEKPVLIFGVIGLIGILIVIAFTNSSSLLDWAIILFLSRTFASATETSINSYLFKHIDETDTGIISLYTASQNFAYFVATPIFGLIIMKYFGLKILFLSVSLFLCFVLVFVSNIKQNHIYEHNRKQRLIRNKAQTKANA